MPRFELSHFFRERATNGGQVRNGERKRSYQPLGSLKFTTFSRKPASTALNVNDVVVVVVVVSCRRYYHRSVHERRLKCNRFVPPSREIRGGLEGEKWTTKRERRNVVFRRDSPKWIRN